MRKVITFFSFIAFVCSSHANNDSKLTKELLSKVSQGTFDKLPGLMASATSWPSAPAAFAVSKLTGEAKAQAELGAELAEAIREKIVVVATPVFKDEGKLDDKTLAALAAIANKLEQNGSYRNLVLANLCAEIALYELSGRILRDPSSASSVKKLAQEFQGLSLDWRKDLLGLSLSDPFFVGKENLMEAAIAKDDLSVAFNALGLPFVEAVTLQRRRSKNYSDMMRDNYVLDVLYTRATTASQFQVGLQGMIDYVNAGGSLNDIDHQNNKRYIEIFRKTASSYKYLPLAITSLGPSDIEYLIRMHEDPRVKMAFTSRILN